MGKAKEGKSSGSAVRTVTARLPVQAGAFRAVITEPDHREGKVSPSKRRTAANGLHRLGTENARIRRDSVRAGPLDERTAAGEDGFRWCGIHA